MSQPLSIACSRSQQSATPPPIPPPAPHPPPFPDAELPWITFRHQHLTLRKQAAASQGRGHGSARGLGSGKFSAPGAAHACIKGSVAQDQPGSAMDMLLSGYLFFFLRGGVKEIINKEMNAYTTVLTKLLCTSYLSNQHFNTAATLRVLCHNSQNLYESLCRVTRSKRIINAPASSRAEPPDQSFAQDPPTTVQEARLTGLLLTEQSISSSNRVGTTLSTETVTGQRLHDPRSLFPSAAAGSDEAHLHRRTRQQARGTAPARPSRAARAAETSQAHRLCGSRDLCQCHPPSLGEPHAGETMSETRSPQSVPQPAGRPVPTRSAASVNPTSLFKRSRRISVPASS